MVPGLPNPPWLLVVLVWAWPPRKPRAEASMLELAAANDKAPRTATATMPPLLPFQVAAMMPAFSAIVIDEGSGTRTI